MLPGWTDRFFWTGDNVRLHYRDYPGADDRPALLCVPGLTRNARDFDAFAARFAPRHRVLTASLRGRGESGYARDPLTYVPLTYLQDLSLLLDDAGVSRVVLVGTSLGGLIGMLLGATREARLAGLVLNDVGPEMEAAGLDRVRNQLGRGGNWASWLIAAREVARRQAEIYPGWSLEQWLTHTKHLCRISREGRIVWDYDPEIAAPFQLPNNSGNAGALDLWLALEGMGSLPLLSIRGDRSDILSADGQAMMARRLPGLRTAVVANVGHAPTLEEPESIAALEGFLAAIG